MLNLFERGGTFLHQEYQLLSNQFGLEYQAGKTFFDQEYRLGKVYVDQNVKNYWSQYMLCNLVSTGIQGIGLLVGIYGIFRKRSSPFDAMHPQGARQTANKAGMFLTGLLSLCMFLLAPIMGTKKILELVKPLIEMLRQVPYVSWVVEFLSKAWKGEADFDDIPEDLHEFHEEQKASSEFAKAQEDLDQVRERLEKRMKSENLDTGKRTPDDLNKEKERRTIVIELILMDDESYTLRHIKKKWQSKLKEVNVLDAVLLGWEPSDGSLTFEGVIFKTKEEFESFWVDEEYESDSVLLEKARKREDLFNARNNKIFDKNDMAGSKSSNGMMFTKSEKVENVSEHDDNFEAFFDSEEESGEVLEAQGKTKAEIMALNGMFKAFGANERFCAEYKNKEYCEARDGEEAYFGEKPECKAEYTQSEKEVNEWVEQIREETGEIPNVNKLQSWSDWCGDILSWDNVCEQAEKCKNYCVAHPEQVAAVVGFVVGLAVVYANQSDDEELTAEGQGVNRHGGKGRKGGRHIRVRGKKNFQSSGGDELMEGPEQISEPEESHHGNYNHDDEPDVYVFSHKMRDRRELDGQGFSDENLELPPLMSDADIRRKIYASKKKVVRAKKADVDSFIKQAQEKFQSALVKCKKQSWNANEKAAGVYKIYNEEERYLCTGTLVGNKMYVVMHCLSENIANKYTARNHVHSLQLLASEMLVMNDDIVAFRVHGIKSPFGNTNLKVLQDAAIVTIFGFGSGDKTTPDSIVGFASPQGWCNAKTRSGDCTSPVLDRDGNIVGFWTHGNGNDFGRFECVTDSFIALAKSGFQVTHNGLDFQSSPLSQKI